MNSPTTQNAPQAPEKGKENQRSADHDQYLTFNLGGDAFALGILSIKEIIEFGAVTEVPMMPDFVRGVINLRGAVVPVIDLAARFGRPRVNQTRRTCIIIMEVVHEGEHQDIGVVVDAVNAVIDIPRGQIEPPPPFGARVRTDFIQGMGKLEDRFIIILDADKVLSIDELAMLDHLPFDPPADEAVAASGYGQ